jgi:predicted PurR-regulated permease PerM
MLLYYGEQIWDSLVRTLSPKLASAVKKMAEISTNTIYALIVVQISAAIISFLLAIPFFILLGADDPLLFATLIGIAMLIPLIGAQIMLLFFALYFMSIGDTGHDDDRNLCRGSVYRYSGFHYWPGPHRTCSYRV